MNTKKSSTKKSTAIDMTAMVDIAFLLLTFLILTAQAKKPEILPVDLPLSAVNSNLPKETAIITISKGKLFFSIENERIRKRALERISEKYNITFTEDEKSSFSKMDGHGIPLSQMKQVLNLPHNKRPEASFHNGIPTDSIGTNPSELYDWIKETRIATKEINNIQLEFAIKGDANESYPTVKKVIDILQSQNINRFHLITNLRRTM
ncbi:biopolymer transporter ExbD [Flavobacterium sp. '19STA2R22 D10 B1']|uniref:biopolymer transporter ExbD n=1 Tax=Flavobacterium aerium TaxID=3037261 RepID=UPI00278C62A8|nr:biopolymer transporter ExbD [Flavobacterium sp. '19STA2R22 D10 B1']